MKKRLGARRAEVDLEFLEDIPYDVAQHQL